MHLLNNQITRYKKFIIGAATAIALTIIFAPMALFSDSGVIGACGHRFLTAPAACSASRYMLARVDYPVLITYWLGIAFILYLLNLTVRIKVDTGLIQSNIKTIESEIKRFGSELGDGQIDLEQYEIRKASSIATLIDNQISLKIAQAYSGSIIQPDVVRRVNISAGMSSTND